MIALHSVDFPMPLRPPMPAERCPMEAGEPVEHVCAAVVGVEAGRSPGPC